MWRRLGGLDLWFLCHRILRHFMYWWDFRDSVRIGLMDDQSALPTALSGMMATLAPVDVLVLLPLLQKVCLLHTICYWTWTDSGLKSVDVIMEHVPPPQSVLVPLVGRPTLSYPRPCATLALKGSFKMSTITVSVGIAQPHLHIVRPNTFTACPLGCETCELQANTNSTAACTSCSSTLTLSTTNPTICVSSNGTCSSGSYYDSSTSSCQR